MELHNTVGDFMVLSCIDSVEEILSDWCDTGAGTKKSDKVVLPPKLPKMHIFGNFEGGTKMVFLVPERGI